MIVIFYGSFFLRSKVGIMVRLFCAAIALVMVLTVDATPKNYNYKQKTTYGGAPSYKPKPDYPKQKTYGNSGYQDNSYGNQERYSPRKVRDNHYQDKISWISMLFNIPCSGRAILSRARFD